ncbi:DNA-binding transcriptional regulator, CsgD family [Hyphomicrobiales bacterium]|nr:DNA-binding transcriptional regulator, CsgD family [Hyphomicrobiales bacterium]CAH1700424.1 DNA-binding transcriptional regulator, CsgD family [Hyphomicrobiales bacterium]CAI0344306.1 DNA-binding transcriptional regulator, CsgD family [Hyphomicrobiales bacterium]
MLDANEFGDAVAMLYEAAAVPDVWPAAIARLADIAGCTGGLLFAHSEQGTNWVASEAFAPVFERFMAQGWMNRNARMAGLLSHGATGFVTDHDLFTDAELEQTALYTQFLRPEGYGWGTATHVRSASGDNIVFTLERKFDLGPVARREIEVLDGIRPHLARAAVLASKLQLQRARASLDSFEKAGSPAALIGARGQVSAANPSFETLLGQVIIRARDKIALDDERANALLQKALSELAQDRLGDTRSIPVPRKDDRPAFIVHVLPIRRQALDIFSRSQAMLVVTTSERSLRIEASLLCELYDLTRAEAAVANGLLDGQSVEEISVSRGVARETIRSQIKRILAKTGCRSQADFIRRLAPLAS